METKKIPKAIEDYLDFIERENKKNAPLQVIFGIIGLCISLYLICLCTDQLVIDFIPYTINRLFCILSICLIAVMICIYKPYIDGKPQLM
jgi:uncharacterized protein YacL